MYKELTSVNPNYELIEVKPNEYVVVDKDSEIKEGDFYVVPHNIEGEILSNKIIVSTATKNFILDYYIKSKKNWWRKIILASQSLNLGAPILELVDEVEDVLIELCKKKGNINNTIDLNAYGIGVIDGYNTHKQSTDKKYSEKDLILAMNKANDYATNHNLWWKDKGANKSMTYDEYQKTIIKSLNQKVLKVEVEEIRSYSDIGKTGSMFIGYQFKVTNGKVKGVIL